MALRLLKSRFWLAHRNGRVCAESSVPKERGNPYRKGSKSYAAFNESYDATTLHRDIGK